MYQNRLSSSGVLAVKAPEVRKLNFDSIIDYFAGLKDGNAAKCQ